MKHKTGDKVKVISELPNETDDLYVTPRMKILEGKTVTIAAEYDDGLYDIKEDGGEHYWSEELFEEVKE